MWKRENKEKHRLHGMQNKCMNTSLASLLSRMLDIAFPFERDAAQGGDSTNNIITGHCGVFLLFPSFFFFRVGSRSGIIPVKGYGPQYSYPRPPLSLPAPPPLLLRVFSCCTNGSYNETGLLVILPVTFFVCLGVLTLCLNLL